MGPRGDLGFFYIRTEASTAKLTHLESVGKDADDRSSGDDDGRDVHSKTRSN